MTTVKTQIWLEPWDVTRRLHEMGLELPPLLDVVRKVVAAGADVTPFHPANAEGMFRYLTGIWAIREAFVGNIWVVDRDHQIEGIKNDMRKIKIAYSNVDLACNDEYEPKPRSRKGAGAERACKCNTIPGLVLPRYVPRQDNEWATFYLMVDENGAAELSQPVIEGETFKMFVERIYLSNGSEFDPERISLDDDDPVMEFDPQVSRK